MDLDPEIIKEETNLDTAVLTEQAEILKEVGNRIFELRSEDIENGLLTDMDYDEDGKEVEDEQDEQQHEEEEENDQDEQETDEKEKEHIQKTKKRRDPQQQQSPSLTKTTIEEKQSLLIQGETVLARLKHLNGKATIRTKTVKAFPSTKRAEMDKAFLQLQNMEFERDHLEREIVRCREYESEYQNVPLHTVEEYFNLSQAEDPLDDHQLMVNRLNFELSERQRSEKERKDLMAEKSKLTKENEETKAHLEDLEKQLDNFISASKTIQQKMADF